MGLDYVRKFYGVPAKRGGRVVVAGRRGTITSASDSYIMVRFDGESTPRRCHPTWRVTYEAVTK